MTAVPDYSPRPPRGADWCCEGSRGSPAQRAPSTGSLAGARLGLRRAGAAGPGPACSQHGRGETMVRALER